MINFFKFYRLINYNSKIAWTRCLAYVILGYAVSGTIVLMPMFLNFLAVLGIFMAAFSLNDYMDYKNGGEKNYMRELMKASGITDNAIILLVFLPLLLMVGALYLNFISVVLLGIFLTVAIAYSLPKINLKTRFGFIYSPICAVLIFLESYLIAGRWNADILFLAVLVFFFHAYTEAVHVLEECQAKERKDSGTKKTAYVVLRSIPFATLLLSIAFSFHNPAFILGIIFSLIRIISLRKINMNFDFYGLHRNLFDNIYAPLEFAGYAVCGCFSFFI